MDCTCLGFLDIDDGRKTIVFYALKHNYQDPGSRSLNNVLAGASDEHRAIPIEDRLQIALSVAAGVLHLHTSSWLVQAWSSKNIYFLDRGKCNGRCTLGEPFLQTQIGSNMHRRIISASDVSADDRSILHSLGLVLIEIAFSAPWHKLRLPEDFTEDLPDKDRYNFELMHLSEIVSRELGIGYAKVVQTCLFPGSGAQVAHGLDNDRLDEDVFKNIVRELDQCVSAVTLKPGMSLSPRVKSIPNDHLQNARCRQQNLATATSKFSQEIPLYHDRRQPADAGTTCFSTWLHWPIGAQLAFIFHSMQTLFRIDIIN